MSDDRNISCVTLTDDAGNVLYRWKVNGSLGYAEPTDEVKKLNGKPVPELTMHVPMDMKEGVEFCRRLLRFGQERLIKAYDVAKGNPAYTSLDGAVYNKDMTKLVLFPQKKEGTFIVPEGVTAIAQEAFVYSHLENIVVPSSLTNLNGYPFESFYNLKKIDVSEVNPAYTSRDGVLYSKDMSMLIRCPKNKTGVLEIPEGVKSVEQVAFRQCRGLESISIPASMEDIPERALFNSHDGIDICENLVSVSVAEGSRHFSSEDGVLYDKKKEKLLLCPEGKRGRLTVPATVQSIKSDLSRCKKLEFIDILGVNTKIDFRYPPALREIHIPENHALYEIVGDCIRDRKRPFVWMRYRSFQIVRIPEGSPDISENNCFHICNYTEILNLPASVTRMDMSYLAGQKRLKDIHIAEGNCMYASKDGIVYSKDMSTLIFCPRGKAGELVVIPDGVTRIAAGSFSDIPLKRLVIPASVTTIDDDAFSSICFPVHVKEGNTVFESRDGKLCKRSGLNE